jgi:uncharacterized membrane protein
MIETHVVNALLVPNLKDESTFKVLTFINGLVAPSFLFCAGFALAISLSKRWNQYIQLEKTFWKYIQRLFFILIVGYSLHLPFFSLKKLLVLTDLQAWNSFFQIDILQTIAITLFLLTSIAVVIRKENIFITAIFSFGLVIVFSAPIIRALDYSDWQLWLRQLFTPEYKSQFPLFPWSAFLISGTILGFLFIKSRISGVEKAFIKRAGIISFFMIIIALGAEFLPFSIYPNHNFWKASPEFFFVRLGLVVLSLVGLWKYEQWKKSTGNSVFSLFGQESLLVYVVHLLIIYGYTYPWSFIRYFGQTLNYAECVGLFFILTLTMYLLAYLWHWLKDWNPRIAKGVQYIWLTAIVLVFILK